MRQFICALLALFVLGCWEAEPDQDTMGELRDTIASIPPEMKHVMARWAANRVAYGYVHGEPYIGHVVCEDPNKPFAKPWEHGIEVTVGVMLHCLNSNLTTTYKTCLDMILEDIADENPDKECRWQSFLHKLNPNIMPPETEADRVTVDTLTKLLLGDPPPLDIQFMLMGLQGMMGPAGALCIQVKREWACAPGPFSDSPGASSAASGGGDR